MVRYGPARPWAACFKSRQQPVIIPCLKGRPGEPHYRYGLAARTCTDAPTAVLGGFCSDESRKQGDTDTLSTGKKREELRRRFRKLYRGVLPGLFRREAHQLLRSKAATDSTEYRYRGAAPHDHQPTLLSFYCGPLGTGRRLVIPRTNWAVQNSRHTTSELETFLAHRQPPC